MECTLKKLIILSLTAFLYGVMSPLALQAAEVRVGFVNVLKVLDKAPQAKSADSRLKKEFEPRERRIARTEEKLRQSEEKLRKEEDIMSTAEAKNLSKDIRDKRRELDREKEDFQDDFNIRRSEEINRLQKQILKAIVSLAEEKGYDLVVGEGVIYASKRIDITQQILDRLSK